MGCAPSTELLATWNKREAELISEGLKTDPHRVTPLACPPTKAGALAGKLDMDSKIAEKICIEGARTVPPREHGGNMDIKNLSKGSVIYFPVYVAGAKLSMGDIHFSQGTYSYLHHLIYIHTSYISFSQGIHKYMLNVHGFIHT
jgi:formamidase